MLVSLPTLGLLFLQNKQVQTSFSEYIMQELSRKFQAEISVSSVHYSFFKRLQLYDLYMEDQTGDTLLYSEICNIRIKTFRPDRKQVKIAKISFDNALFRVVIDENQVSSIQFAVDSLRRDIPPEEKVVVNVGQIYFFDSRFRLINHYANGRDTGVDFTDLDVSNVHIKVEDLQFKYDTTSFLVTSATARDKSGFVIDETGFFMTYSKKFMNFSDGWIHTALSDANLPMVELRYNHPKNLKYVYDSVHMEIASSGSHLDFEDIEYFFPQTRGLTGKIDLNGSIRGKPADFSGNNISVDYMDNTRLEFDMRLAGLPSPDSLFMDFNFEKFKTIPAELKSLTSSYDLGFIKDTLLYPGLTELRYQGSFKGYKTDFETNGLLGSNVGDIFLDLNMRPDSTKKLRFRGDMGSTGLDLGKLVDRSSNVGSLAFNIAVDGINTAGDFEFNAAGSIDTLGLYGYDYSNIRLEGAFTNRKFDGSLVIMDPNIDMNFAGRIDFETKLPTFDFRAKVDKLMPYYLNLRDDDPEYFASFILDTRMTGSNIGNLNGQIRLVNSHFKRTGSEIKMENFVLDTENGQDTSYITLRSDQADAGIIGHYDLLHLPDIFAGLINEHFEVFKDLTPLPDPQASFMFYADIGNIDPIMEFFFPKYKLDPGIHLNGEFLHDSTGYSFNCDGYFPAMSYASYRMDEMDLSILSDTTELSLLLSGANLLSTDGFEIRAPEIALRFKENRNDLLLHWDNDSLPRYSGDIVTKGSISNNDSLGRSYTMRIEPSYFYYDNKKFVLPGSVFTMKKDTISADSIYILGSDQFILADGDYTVSPSDSITLQVHNLNLQLFNELFSGFPVTIGGMLSGHTSIKKQNEHPLITSSLLAEDLVLNEQYLGQTLIRADWLRKEKELDLEISNAGSGSSNINLLGRFNPFNRGLDLNLDLSEVGLNAFMPFINIQLEDLEGSGDVDLDITGTLNAPVIDGIIRLNNAGAMLSETQTRYYSSDAIRISANDFYLDDVELDDEFGGTIIATGAMKTNDFSQLELDIQLRADNFKFLSTTRFDNEQLYGDIYASGLAFVTGPVDQMHIEAKANTEKLSNLKLPLYNTAEIQTTDYITFIRADDSPEPVPPAIPRRKNKVTLELEVDIYSNSSVQLIFDPKVGDIIEASGNGALSINIDENGDLNMYGTVAIESGSYLFTLQNVINKRFMLEPGGTIRWNGSPTSAILDLEAIYETKASIYNLAPVKREYMKKRIPVHCLLSLQGELTNPTIDPSIELPTAEPESRSVVETSIGTEEELMRQFISLLVINNFITSAETGYTAPVLGTSSGVAGVTASELLSNQLSNWLSQISNDFDIGVNYRPGDAISSDEVEVALSTQLLNDRIIFSGNLDVLGDEVTTSEGQASNIVGDFDLEFRVTDKVSIKAFNRVNDDRIVRPSLYTQGVGLIYRSEFNTLEDLFRREDNNARKPEDQSPVEEESENSSTPPAGAR